MQSGRSYTRFQCTIRCGTETFETIVAQQQINGIHEHRAPNILLNKYQVAAVNPFNFGTYFSVKKCRIQAMF